MEAQRPKNSAFEVGDAAVNRGGSLDDDNGSALGDNSGGSLGEHAYYPRGNRRPVFLI